MMEIIVIIAYVLMLVGGFVLEFLGYLALMALAAIYAFFQWIFGKKDKKKKK